jgi:hypothetical protein
MELILATLWGSGEADVSEAAIRAITPNEQDFPGYHLSATAHFLMIQLRYSLIARRLCTIEAAMEALDASYETAYMYVREAEDDDELAPRVHIMIPGTPQYEADTKRHLAAVQAEVDARTVDVNDPQLRTLDFSNFGTFREP